MYKAMVYSFLLALLLTGWQASAADSEIVRIDVSNMTCATCPITVRKAMERVEGVISVKVDMDSARATVKYDPALASPEAIADASTSVGFPAKVAATSQ